MRGGDVRTESLFSYVSCEARVPQGPSAAADPGARRRGADGAVAGLRPALCATIGRPSIPPEKLLRALLLQAFYSVRSERQLMEQLDYNLLFRWFVGLAMDAPSGTSRCSPRTATGCWRARSPRKFFQAVLGQPQVRALLSDEHFSVDGTLIEAWASMKSFSRRTSWRRAAGGRRRRAQRRARLPRREAPNDTHASTTDPDARLFRKGARQGGQALPHGPPADGEPQRADRRCAADARPPAPPSATPR